MSAATVTGTPVSYERISRFRVNQKGIDAEVSRGVDRQADDNRQASLDLGLGPVTRQFTDNNRSASQFRTKEREAWADLLAYVRTGAVSHVIVWLLDRAYRTTDDCQDLLAACREGGALIVQSASRDVADPNSPDDIFRMKLAGLLAEYEIAKMSVRARRAKVEAAKNGKAHGGRRAFGYLPGKVGFHEAEAAIIRDLATRLLAGDSLRTLAKELNAQGVATPSTAQRLVDGKAPAKWTGPNLRQMMLGPGLAGLRVHQGQVIGEAAWEGVIPVETHQHLVSLMTDPARRPATSNARKWLLTGLAVCDACDAPLRVHTSRRDTPVAYACPSGRHVHRSEEKVRAVVEAAVIGRLSRYDATGLLVDDAAADEVLRLRDARAALDDAYGALGDLLADGTLTPKAYAASTARLEAQMDQVDAEARDAARAVNMAARVLDGATGEAAAQAWEGFSLARRRAIIRELCAVRLVGVAERGGPRTFLPSDVVITWN